MKNDPIVAALARLDEIDPQTADGKKHLAKALSAKSNLVAAKAARIAGETLCADLMPDLAAAFGRFLEKGAALDKGCAASTAIARALVAFDCDDASLFRRGIKHVQMEAVWGGAQDTAAELRSICAMGLANSGDPRRLRDLTELLVDREWTARAGAVRAIAAVGSEAASLLLRYKTLLGDKDAEVLSESISALLETDGAEALPLACELAGSRTADVRETAILALGASRRADAIEWLKQQYEHSADTAAKKCILLALASSRTEAAIDFLLGLIRDASPGAASLALSALTIQRADPHLRAAVEEAARNRTDIPKLPE
ncbi:MAG TPA: HEAT repeat domain-containing protein [Bryobacteraceae bacterium]|nr:HEAT repeat domain-containing protein [Bryobacteraceae bacterium]